MNTMYRRLDDQQIASTLARLRDRIAERFPGSGLSHVADELRSLRDETTALVAYVQRPHWPIRIGAGAAIAAMLAVLVVVVSYLPLSGPADPAWLAITYATARAVYSGTSQRCRRELSDLADRLAAVAEDEINTARQLSGPS